MLISFKKHEKKDLEKRLTEHPDTPIAQGTRIHYHPELIADLKQDHRDLLALHDEIQTRFETNDYETVAVKVGQFRADLQKHLLAENVLLYVYLGHVFADDEAKAKITQDFRFEMTKIGRFAARLLKKYENIDNEPDLVETFHSDFFYVGRVLGERIEREEQVLYPLYGPMS